MRRQPRAPPASRIAHVPVEIQPAAGRRGDDRIDVDFEAEAEHQSGRERPAPVGPPIEGRGHHHERPRDPRERPAVHPGRVREDEQLQGCGERGAHPGCARAVPNPDEHPDPGQPRQARGQRHAAQRKDRGPENLDREGIDTGAVTHAAHDVHGRETEDARIEAAAVRTGDCQAQIVGLVPVENDVAAERECRSQSKGERQRQQARQQAPECRAAAAPHRQPHERQLERQQRQEQAGGQAHRGFFPSGWKRNFTQARSQVSGSLMSDTFLPSENDRDR